MIPDSLDFIRRGTNDEQAEYAAAHKTPAPADAGEAEAGAGQTPASPTVPLGEAGPHSFDADAVGAPASEVQTPAAEHGQERCPSGPVRSAAWGPRWAPVDENTSDTLRLLAIDGVIPVDEWPYFLSVLKKVAAENEGLIDQNITRPMLRGQIRPARVGSYFHRAARMGLIRADGWNESNDREQRNGGKPIRLWRYLGT
jgi:hypothetical protein